MAADGIANQAIDEGPESRLATVVWPDEAHGGVARFVWVLKRVEQPREQRIALSGVVSTEELQALVDGRHPRVLSYPFTRRRVLSTVVLDDHWLQHSCASARPSKLARQLTPRLAPRIEEHRKVAPIGVFEAPVRCTRLVGDARAAHGARHRAARVLPAPLGQAGRVNDVATRRHCATLRARQRLVADGAVVVQIERAPFALGDLELAEGKGVEADDSDLWPPRANNGTNDAQGLVWEDEPNEACGTVPALEDSVAPRAERVHLEVAAVRYGRMSPKDYDVHVEQDPYVVWV